MNKSTKRFAISTLLAAVVGYIAGILTAPKSGKETRADIKDAAQKGMVEAEKRLKQLHTQLSEIIEEGRNKLMDVKGKAQSELSDLVEKTKAAKEKAREMLSGLHEGEANDDDLKNTIAEANKALENLRKYLKKI